VNPLWNGASTKVGPPISLVIGGLSRPPAHMEARPPVVSPFSIFKEWGHGTLVDLQRLAKGSFFED